MATAKTFKFEPGSKIVLKGDPSNPESAEHHIIFPGGSISVCRTTDGNYWAHVYVNEKEVIEGTTVQAKKGTLERLRTSENHFAVLISIDE